MKRLEDQILFSIIKWQISQVEKTGDQVGSSGHLGHTSIAVNKIMSCVESGNGWKVSFEYSQTTETEFTIYPHNPPAEVTRTGEMLIDDAVMTRYESDINRENQMRDLLNRRFLDSLDL